MNCCSSHKDDTNKAKEENKTHTPPAFQKKDAEGIKDKLPYLCGIGVVGAIAAVTIFKISPANLLFYGLILACPLAHIFMMKDHGSHEDKSEKKQ